MTGRPDHRLVTGGVLARGVGHRPPTHPHPGRRAGRPRPAPAGPLRGPRGRRPLRAAPRAAHRPHAGPDWSRCTPVSTCCVRASGCPVPSARSPTGPSAARWPVPSTISDWSTRWCGSTTRPTPASRCRPDGPPSTTSPTTGCWPRCPPVGRHGCAPTTTCSSTHSGAVVVCSPDLARTRGRRRSVDLIPNGVDVDLFRTPQARPADLPPSPVAVYVGTLHEERIDVPLLVSLAEARPDVAIAVVGPDSLGPASHGSPGRRGQHPPARAGPLRPGARPTSSTPTS